jgi:hypothetical protein
MHVHLFNWPVSPSYIGWADPVKITASGGALKGGWFNKSHPLFLLGFENQIYWQIEPVQYYYILLLQYVIMPKNRK